MKKNKTAGAEEQRQQEEPGRQMITNTERGCTPRFASGNHHILRKQVQARLFIAQTGLSCLIVILSWGTKFCPEPTEAAGCQAVGQGCMYS